MSMYNVVPDSNTHSYQVVGPEGKIGSPLPLEVPAQELARDLQTAFTQGSNYQASINDRQAKETIGLIYTLLKLGHADKAQKALETVLREYNLL